jgi:hypothetical protein
MYVHVLHTNNRVSTYSGASINMYVHVLQLDSGHINLRVDVFTIKLASYELNVRIKNHRYTYFSACTRMTMYLFTY